MGWGCDLFVVDPRRRHMCSKGTPPVVRYSTRGRLVRDMPRGRIAKEVLPPRYPHRVVIIAKVGVRLAHADSELMKIELRKSGRLECAEPIDSRTSQKVIELCATLGYGMG